MHQVPKRIPEVTASVTQTCLVENTGYSGVYLKSQLLLHDTSVYKHPRPAGHKELPICTVQDPKCGNSQGMGQELTTAGRASKTGTRAKENSVFTNSGQLISLSALGSALALFLSHTAGSGVKAGSLFWSFCQKAKAQSLGTIT